ncbi:MAG: hypothetical protein ACT4O0_14645 [Pseudonocardia sp.]
MDDRQAGELFRTAADEVGRTAPPPAFDHADVVAGCRRATRRQRMLVGTATAVTLLAATGALVTGALTQPDPTTSALAGSQPSLSVPYAPGPTGQRGADGGADAAAPEAAPGAPGVGAPNAAPDVGGPAAGARSESLSEVGGPGCVEPDVRVFAQLAAALPGARSTRPYAVPGGCVAGGVGVALDVFDDSSFGGARGTLVVVLTPAGADSGAPMDGPHVVSGVAPARSGGIVRVTAGSAGNGQVPYRQRVVQLATQLAGKL